MFEDIFAYILEQAVKAGFVTEDNLYLDSTHIKANANKHKFTKEMTHDEAKAYQDELEDEINRQRIEAGKRPFTLDLEKEVKLKERKISKADPESGYYVKGEREKQFAYSAHTSCDDNGFILSTIITPGNIHDSQVAFQLVKQSKRLFPEINCVVADAGYKTPKFVHFLTHLNLRPCLPYSRPKGKKGLLSKNEFLYDEYFDCYICPQDQMLAFSTVTREGYREYKSNPKECVNCPLLNQCTISKNHQRVITRHVWGDLMDEVEHLRLTDLNKSIYKNGNKRLNEYLRMQKKSMGCVGPSIEAWKKSRRIRC